MYAQRNRTSVFIVLFLPEFHIENINVLFTPTDMEMSRRCQQHSAYTLIKIKQFLGTR